MIKELLEDKEKRKELVNKLVPPHTKISRKIEDSDLDRVKEEAKTLYGLCFVKYGIYNGALAMHHSQIDDKDPLDFFVTAQDEIIINPVIINHTKTPVDSFEGCVTFNDKPMIKVHRWHKVEVEYQILTPDGKLTIPIGKNESGRRSFMFQHETDHGQAKYIYPILDH